MNIRMKLTGDRTNEYTSVLNCSDHRRSLSEREIDPVNDMSLSCFTGD